MTFLRNSFCLQLQPSYRNNDMMFYILSSVLCHTFCMWHWPICESLDLRFIWGHHRLHYFSEWLVNQPITSHIFLLHNAGETQECRNSCPWPQFLAFCLRSKYIVIILLGFLGSNQCWIIVKDKKTTTPNSNWTRIEDHCWKVVLQTLCFCQLAFQSHFPPQTF